MPSNERSKAVGLGIYLANNDSKTSVFSADSMKARSRGLPEIEHGDLDINPDQFQGTSQFAALKPASYANAGSEDFLDKARPPRSRPYQRPSSPSIYSVREESESDNATPRGGAAAPYSGGVTEEASRFGVDPHSRPFPTELPPRPPSRRSTLRRSVSALSLTPANLLYPPQAFNRQDNAASPRTLGLSKPLPKTPQSLFELALVTERNSRSPEGVPQASATGQRGSQDTIPRKSRAAAAPSDAPPDGGFLAWAHAYTAALVIFSCFGLNYSFGVLEQHYSTELLRGTSPSRIAWIGSTQLAFISLLSTPIGWVIDSYPKSAMMFFRLGSAGLVLCVFLTSVYRTWAALLVVQGVATGVAMGMVCCSGILILMGYFRRNIGLAMAVGAVGSSVGGILYTLMAQRLLARVGFGWTMRSMGFVVLATLIPPNIVFRTHPRPPTAAKQSFDWSGLCDKAFLFMVAGMFFAFMGLYFSYYYMIAYATLVLHMSSSSATSVLLALLASNIPGRILPSLLSDRCIGPLNTLIPSTLLSAMIVFLWIGTTTPGGLYLVACFYGFASAGLQSLYAVTVHAFNVGREGEAGVRTGVVFTGIGIGMLVGTPVGARLIRRGEEGKVDFVGAQVFTGCCLTIGAACFLVSRWCRVGWKAQRA